MDQGIIVAILSILFYLANLLGGGAGQPIQSLDPPAMQQSYQVLGQAGEIVVDSITVRSGPSSETEALGTVHKENGKLILLDQTEGWYRIRPNIGPTGWVPAYAVSITPTQREEQNQMVLGVYTPGTSAYGSLIENGPNLTSVAPFGWKLDSYGGLVANFDPQEMGRSLYFAGNQELKSYGHVELSSNPSRILNNAYLQENSKEQLVNMVEEWGLKGLLIELNYVPGSEQAQLFEFIKSLATTLESKGFKTLLGLPWNEDIDYLAASKVVDYIVLRSATEKNAPGPLAPLPELEASLKAISKTVDPNKIILALETSGLDWSRTGTSEKLSHEEVLELAARQGANVRWDADSMSPYFQYGNGREVWFENRYSLKYKLELVPKYRLGGIALLNLGQEDPEVWATISSLIG